MLFQKAGDLVLALGRKGQGSAYAYGVFPLCSEGESAIYLTNVLVESKPPRIHTSV